MTMIDFAEIAIPAGYRLVPIGTKEDENVLGALGQLWAKIRELNPSVGAAVFDLTPGREIACTNVSWDLASPIIEVNLRPGGKPRTGKDLLQVLLHAAAHSVSFDPGTVTGTHGRYHPRSYRAAALELGLDVEPNEPDGLAGNGFSETSLASGTLSRYRNEVGKLERALAKWEPTVTPKTGRTKTNPELAVCSCTPPRRIRVWPSALDLGVIRCEICGEPFQLVSAS
jgi:hypothetical protein